MTTYILEGGLGNLLFQTNYYLNCLDYLSNEGIDQRINLGIINGFVRDLYFRISPINANRDINILLQLTGHYSISNLHDIPLFGLGISKLSQTSFAGFYHDNTSHLSIPSSLKYKYVFTYGQNQIPISKSLLSELRKNLLYSQSALEISQQMDSELYEAVLHYRGGDNSMMESISPSYIKETCSLYRKVLVITNDIPKAKTLFTDSKFCFLRSHQSLFNDLAYMANAKALICSNSTLSWWASEISHSSQIVHFPSYHSVSPHFNPASYKQRFLHH